MSEKTRKVSFVILGILLFFICISVIIFCYGFVNKRCRNKKLNKNPHHFKKLYIVSCGMGDSRYAQLSEDLLKKIQLSYPDSIPVIYDTAKLPDWMVEVAKLHKRGFGFWIWKPFCVNQFCLETAEDGDIVAYFDGRCDIVQVGKRIPVVDAILDNPAIDVCAWQMEHVEQVWSRADLMASFGVIPNSAHANTGQFAATFFVIRVNCRTRNLMQHWYDFMRTQFNLVTDASSQIANAPGFSENRHDQSVFSMLLKTAPGLNVHVVNSISPVKVHAKPHPNPIGAFLRRATQWL